MTSLRLRNSLFFPALRLAVGCLILAIGLRTWLVMGLIEPVTVAGSSMVPSLRSGDRLWVDRASQFWRSAKRWDVVVARNPQDGEGLCIKRIVGLPGEHIALLDGDVFVDDAVVVKTRDERRALRRLVHRTFARKKTRWQLDTGVWQYQHPGLQPITDDVADNVGLTRKLNLVDEFLLVAELRVQGAGTLCLTLDDGTTMAQVELGLPGGEMTVVESGDRKVVGQLSMLSRERLGRGKVQLEFSNFDQQLILVIDGQVEFCRPWPGGQAAGTARPMSIGGRGLDLWLGELALYRDIYYSSHAVGTAPPPAIQWQLGPDEYFLLGDNPPISLDCRLWGPVPGRLLVGRPFASSRK